MLTEKHSDSSVKNRCFCGNNSSFIGNSFRDIKIAGLTLGTKICLSCFVELFFVSYDQEVVFFLPYPDTYTPILKLIKGSKDISFKEGLISRVKECFLLKASAEAVMYSTMGSVHLAEPITKTGLELAEKNFVAALKTEAALSEVKAGIEFIKREKLRRKYVICSLCKEDSVEKICDNIFGQSIVMCKKCGLIYRNYQPYLESYKDNYGQEYIEYRNKIIDWRGWQESRNYNMEKVGLKEFEDELAENKHMLEVGCAEGQMLSLFRDRGWSVCGTDISQEMTAYARNKLNVNAVAAPLEKTNFPENSFELVVMFHVIEHLPDPDWIIKEIYRILKPNGKVIIETPCYDLVNINNAWFNDEDHFTFFSESTIKGMLYQNRFKNLKTYGWELKVERPTDPDGIEMFYMIISAEKQPKRPVGS